MTTTLPLATSPLTNGRAAIVIHRAPEVVSVESFGRDNWRLGDVIEWHVAILDGQVIGRRRTRGEAAELLRSRISGS